MMMCHFFKTPCYNEPCKNGATCLAKYEDDIYECACVTGYAGNSCETGICKKNIYANIICTLPS